MLRQGLSWRLVLVLGIGTAVVSWLLGRWWMASGQRPLEVPWLAAGLLATMAVTVLVVGWPLRRYRRGGEHVQPLRAARVLGLAQASALTGALVAGLYLGHAALIVDDLGFARNGELALRLVLAAAAGALVAAAGLVTQSWCRVRDDEDEPLD